MGDLYCADNGRPSIDPVVLFKMILIQHLFGIPSLRKTAEEVRLNVAYRWFLGYLLNEQTPHFSTLSHNFRNRYTPKIVEAIFFWILDEINNAGYLSPEAVFIDGTHIKANANTKKTIKKAVPQAAKMYEEQLMNEINEERESNGKKPFDGPKSPEEKEVTVSITDPECGVFHKGEHKKCMRYTLHRGLSYVTNWVRLKFAAMNLKKFAIRRWNEDEHLRFYFIFPLFSRIYA